MFWSTEGEMNLQNKDKWLKLVASWLWLWLLALTQQTPATSDQVCFHPQAPWIKKEM